jgi:hypothetical protein
LSISLTSCQTTEQETIDIPPFEVVQPSRPLLVIVPKDTTGAIKSLTENMSLLAEYAEKLEVFVKYQSNYYTSILEIISQ